MTRTVTLAQEYFHPWPNSAGFYLARAAGWYAEVGIDLEMLLPDPGVGDALEYVHRGRADLAVFPSSRLLQRRDAGQALVAVAAVNQRGLETVRTLPGTGAGSLRDLAGRRVGLNPTPRGRAIVRDLVARDGGDTDAVELVDLGARELTTDEIAEGGVDATYGSYWAWDNLRDEPGPDGEVTWAVDEHLGVGYHSYLLGMAESWRDAEPGLVEAFVQATARGFEAAAADPDRVADLYEHVTPYFPRRLLRRSAELVATSWLHEGAWGAMREEQLAPYAAWMARHGLVADAGVWRPATAGGRVLESVRR